ncbi:hypothetical protein [Lacrimispora sp.]|uniref:hypothetical protein n=1 Tax=Lacrimispora sp. TaxID=2719234 RepID=UPI0034609F52
MEEMELAINQTDHEEPVKVEGSRWYEVHISLEDIDTFIKANMATVARSFIAIGFYLKRARDEELFKEEGYQNIWDFSRERYGLSKTYTSRYMSMNDRFSENGNSPNVRQEYRAYKKGQLQEMLYLEDDQLEQVTPQHRVEDIRSMRKPKEVPYIELPGQMEIEIDFPDMLPDPPASPLISRKQTFEMSVEDMLSAGEREGIAISQQDQEPGEEKLSPIQRGCITGMSPYGFCSCCGRDGAECCADCEESCNGRCGWIEDVPSQVQKPENNQESGTFNPTPTNCSHREGYSCTVLEENRSVPGDGSNCGSSCCWECKFQGMCKYECNASAGRNGEIPEFDAAWFVKQWAKRSPGDLKKVLEACRTGSTNAERAKAVQEKISPYGAYCHYCWEYNFSFHGFAGGMDFRIGKVEIHLKYGRFVQELINLYPDFEEPVSKEPESVIEEPETEPEQAESVPDCPETVIDGEFVEVPPEQELSARLILEEEKKELQSWTDVFDEAEEKYPPMVERQKIIVAALTAMVAELEKPEPEKQEQPELPILKNNDQRKEFIENYTTWPLWIETKETGERYYRYNLSEKIAMVVKVSWKHPWSSGKAKECEYGAEQYYLLGVGTEWKSGKNIYVEDETRTFYECSSNMSALVEYLKEFQKKK